MEVDYVPFFDDLPEMVIDVFPGSRHGSQRIFRHLQHRFVLSISFCPFR